MKLNNEKNQISNHVGTYISNKIWGGDKIWAAVVGNILTIRLNVRSQVKFQVEFGIGFCAE